MPKPITLKDHYRETRVFARRSVVGLAFVFVLILCLIARMVWLQVIHYEKYRTMSDDNRITVEPIGPNRGLIMDRNGTLLADNRPSYALSIIKEKCPDIDATIERIGTLIPLDDAQIDRFQKRLEQRQRPYTPVALKFKLTEEEIAIIALNQHSLPGVMLDVSLVRHYPWVETLAHTVGYVGRINEKELKTLDPTNYSATEHVGKTGIEAYYEDVLHGTVGFRTIETDARGRVTRVLESTDPEPGKNLMLYLDLPTQIAAYKALEGRRGAVVAIEPATGGVLAFVSVPGFDPNLFVTGIDYKSYQDLQNSLDRPLYNRSIQGQYPPGSTIKPIMGLAGLHYGLTDWDRSIYDPGFYKLENDNHYYRDWKKWGHGVVDLRTAIVQSCDTYFYDLAFKMGVDRIHDFFEPFGFGHRTGVDVTGEGPGLLPSRFWKKAKYNQSWYPGETLITGIGQGYMLSTPLQLALSTAIIANKGHIVKPHMVKMIQETPVTDPEPLGIIELKDPSNWDRTIAAMRDVVHSPQGTAKGIAPGLTYEAAGKTGTAQVVGIKQNESYDASKLAEWHKDHALFIGFAPVNNPRIAVAVLVENGGGGGSTAAPVGRKVMDAYFESLAQDEISNNRPEETASAQ
ncbi:MAG: penicillin-binding protein 2 [Gammaproteobacteria bacterium]|nr:penicillin-binding protein 2 [Gammaproteobacteria bacterium]